MDFFKRKSEKKNLPDEQDLSFNECAPNFKSLDENKEIQNPASVSTSFFRSMDETISKKQQQVSTVHQLTADALTISDFLQRQSESLLNNVINDYLAGNLDSPNIANIVNLANQELMNGTLILDASIAHLTPINFMGYLFSYAYDLLNQQADSIESELESCKELLAQRDYNISQLQIDITNLNRGIEQLEDANKDLSENIVKYKEFYDTHQNTVPVEVHTELQKQLELYSSYVRPEKYEEVKCKLEQAQLALESEAPTVPLSKYEELQAFYKELKESSPEELIDDLTKDKAEKDAKITELNLQINTLNTEKLKLNQKLKTFTSQEKLIAGLKSEIDSLLNTVKANSDEILNLTEENANLKVDLENRNNSLNIAKAISRTGTGYTKDTLIKLMIASQKLLVYLSNTQYKDLLPNNVEYVKEFVELESQIPDIIDYKNTKELEKFVKETLDSKKVGGDE